MFDIIEFSANDRLVNANIIVYDDFHIESGDATWPPNARTGKLSQGPSESRA